MKLYITPGSPYARMARIVVLERRLENRVEVVAAQTRLVDSPYYQINPSGRVPYLLRDDGVGLDESAIICRYLDHLVARPEFDLPAGDQAWETLRLGALATSLLDGLSVWLRETRRPESQQSPTTIHHETERAKRLIDHWETEIDHPLMLGKLNVAQITLVCALGLEVRNPTFRWREGHSKLRDWFGHMSARSSFAKTAPPEDH
jgi:glutathione S-transferase